MFPSAEFIAKFMSLYKLHITTSKSMEHDSEAWGKLIINNNQHLWLQQICISGIACKINIKILQRKTKGKILGNWKWYMKYYREEDDDDAA